LIVGCLGSVPADNLPERRLGVVGIGLILCGFTLQSIQYWLALHSMCT